MTIRSRLNKLRDGQRVIVVNLDDYRADIEALGLLADENKKAEIKALRNKIDFEAGVTGNEIVIWTITYDTDVQITIYRDLERNIVTEYATPLNTPWQDAIKTAPVNEGGKLLFGESLTEARHNAIEIIKGEYNPDDPDLPPAILITRMDMDEI